MLFQKGHKINQGRKCSEETRKKIGAANAIALKGKKHSEETKKKIGSSSKGRKCSEETRKKLSETKKGNTNKLGWKTPIETRLKQSRAVASENRWNWKGGISPLNTKIRSSLEYKLWREAVFARDNYTCVWCGYVSGSQKDTNGKWIRIEADHIKRFCDYPELRFAIDNGRTLCVPCHKTTETYGNKKQKEHVEL